MAVTVDAKFRCPLPPPGSSEAKSKPKAVLVLVSRRVTRGREENLARVRQFAYKDNSRLQNKPALSLELSPSSSLGEREGRGEEEVQTPILFATGLELGCQQKFWRRLARLCQLEPRGRGGQGARSVPPRRGPGDSDGTARGRAWHRRRLGSAGGARRRASNRKCTACSAALPLPPPPNAAPGSPRTVACLAGGGAPPPLWPRRRRVRWELISDPAGPPVSLFMPGSLKHAHAPWSPQTWRGGSIGFGGMRIDPHVLPGKPRRRVAPRRLADLNEHRGRSVSLGQCGFSPPQPRPTWLFSRSTTVAQCIRVQNEARLENRPRPGTVLA
ncbi:uncharacterized protein LOC124243421 [Equus quagga]|uniref:uncharacterized protein LOC124243421 n=1 Tax=Equus quagga TaxID=89248 RepID=UPI001EE396AC|nr:uncharacterized protein LOC124243421 [Equus quagga]